MRSTAESSPVRYLPVAASYHRASSCRRSFSAPSEPRPTLAEVGQIVIGFAHHAPLDRAPAKRAGPDGQRSSIDSTIAADSASAKSSSTKTGTRRRGLSAPNSAVFKSPASNDSVLR